MPMKTPQKSHLAGRVGGKTVLWLPETDHYVLAVPPADDIARLIADGRESKEIIDYCSETLRVPQDLAVRLEREMRESLAVERDGDDVKPDRESYPNLFSDRAEPPPFSEKLYRVFGRNFRVEFPSAKVEGMIHPKFAHLEIRPGPTPQGRFQMDHRDGYYALYVDGQWIGAWPEAQAHCFGGQFSMKLLEKAYRTSPNQWMAVLHGACVSSGRNGLLFVGDSGAGKSTLAALLLARGFETLADDFAPLESGAGEVCSFPAAISIKKEALQALAPAFPALEKAQEYRYPGMGKTVRYLPIDKSGEEMPRKVTCRGLVFVEYKPGIAFRLQKMAPEDAFALLLPDTWIRPDEKNARRFVEWFARLPCYRLAYSDNEKMIESMGKLLDEAAR